MAIFSPFGVDRNLQKDAQLVRKFGFFSLSGEDPLDNKIKNKWGAAADGAETDVTTTTTGSIVPDSLNQISAVEENKHYSAPALRLDFEMTPRGRFLQSQFKLALDKEDPELLLELLEQHPEMVKHFLKDAANLSQKKWELLSGVFKALEAKGLLAPAIQDVKNAVEHQRSLQVQRALQPLDLVNEHKYNSPTPLSMKPKFAE